MKHINLNAVLVIAFAISGPALAQTAEETVAFMTEGMEDGREVTSGGVEYTISQEDGKASYVITSSSSPPKVELRTVRQIDSCTFDISAKGNPDLEGEYIIDFSRFIGARENAGFVFLNFTGKCPLKFRGECLKEHLVSTGFEVDPRRLSRAIDYFKRTYCAGMAY